ncbi:unnamed protein product (macronuclear) [Paramecium tetraurelia]|uniref:Uncharacterized protein n=1 Tax=Paramecium tetraurelia TaxID=5888 RepID=A0DQ91_PARTE|nr:uncharacterized protein GSPATT00002608001 [Paramecium tetraurelia]CAK85208.1 unnamed protein product [Paramecium tetraurelia]|eukprot:XP_001452605.1 hypothetical protein (macronuclear) [Paramecium tetraurelia strain d4-2]
MGNICLSQNQTVSQKGKLLRICGYTNLKQPNKQILHPQIQNLAQNLDTFEEDFFKNEFLFDITDENITNNCSSKIKLERVDLVDIQPNIMQERPSLNFLGEQQIQYKINLNRIQDEPLNCAFIKEKSKKDERSFKKSQKSHNKPVQKKNQPRSILKQKKQNHPSWSNFSDKSRQHSVSFNLLPSKVNDIRPRSMTPLILTCNSGQVQNIPTKCTIFMQQFPYL